jgi:hypothetical protein
VTGNVFIPIPIQDIPHGAVGPRPSRQLCHLFIGGHLPFRDLPDDLKNFFSEIISQSFGLGVDFHLSQVISNVS